MTRDDLEINIKENQSGMEEKFSSRASISDNEAIQGKNAQFKLVSTFVHLVNKLGRHSEPCNPVFFVKTNNSQQKYLMIANKIFLVWLDRCKSQF